jgi:hypothetical protein
MSSPLKNDEAGILSRAIDPERGNWDPAIAQGFLSIALSAHDRSRMNELAAKSRDGQLSAMNSSKSRATARHAA